MQNGTTEAKPIPSSRAIKWDLACAEIIDDGGNGGGARGVSTEAQDAIEEHDELHYTEPDIICCIRLIFIPRHCLATLLLWYIQDAALAVHLRSQKIDNHCARHARIFSPWLPLPSLRINRPNTVGVYACSLDEK